MTNDQQAGSGYSLTPLQEGMLYDHMVRPASGLDIEQIVGEFRETVEIDKLRNAWDLAVARHPVLRTRVFVSESGEARQEAVTGVTHPFEVEDLSRATDAEASERIKDYLDKDRGLGFDLDRAPLSRVRLFLRGLNRYTLVWTFHHIILDGRSHARVLHEVYRDYARLSAGTAVCATEVPGFRDHVTHVRASPKDRAESYWRLRLAGLDSPTRLSQAGIGFGLASRRDGHDQVTFDLSEERTRELHAAAVRLSVTTNSVLQAAWGLLLSRYSGQKMVVFGGIRAGRPTAGRAEDAPVGLFINNVPTVVKVDGEMGLVDLVREVRGQHVEVREHEHVPLSLVQGWSPLPANVPLFDTLFMYDHRDLHGALCDFDPAWEHREVALLERTGYPVTLLACGLPRLRVTLRYDRRQFDGQIMTQVLSHLDKVLEQFVRAPETMVSRVTLLNDAERRRVVEEFNDTHVEYPAGETLVSLFEAQVERTPDAPAVMFESTAWTYRQLSDQAEAVARSLEAAGVGPETVVGVLVERSLEMMATLLGILKAGGAYLPLNPEDPGSRITFMLDNASAKVVLAQQKLAGMLANREGRVLTIEDCLRGAEPGGGELRPVCAENLAYVLYTSGSTGRPKGVMIEHRSICNRLRWMQDTYKLSERDRVMQKTPLTFDVSVWEVFWPILFGATVVVAAPGRHRDPRYLVETIQSSEVTICHFVPSMLRHFLGEEGIESCESLRTVVCSGEELTVGDVGKFRTRSRASLHNLYGPTEAAVDVSYWPCDRETCCSSVPIGWPVANTSLYVLDPAGEPCPIAVPGELYISGVQVGRGYVNRPDLTSERFLADHVSGRGGTMYRTGDRARFLPDGAVEFLGRNDLEVKLNGVRIDLREIETALREHSHIDDAVVVLREANNGQKRLIAYYTQKRDLKPEDARNWLRNLLPQTMVPSVFVPLATMPLGTAGKVARAQLPEPPEAENSPSGRRAAQGSDLEIKIGRIWADALGLPEVGTEDNFFDLGGHSMMLLAVHRRIEDALGTKFPITKSLEHTTVSSLARYLENQSAPSRRVARARSRGAQRRFQVRASGSPEGH